MHNLILSSSRLNFLEYWFHDVIPFIKWLGQRRCEFHSTSDPRIHVTTKLRFDKKMSSKTTGRILEFKLFIFKEIYPRSLVSFSFSNCAFRLMFVWKNMKMKNTVLRKYCDKISVYQVRFSCVFFKTFLLQMFVIWK